ncbi:MAG TPA: hypothetical protein VJY33_17425 [Isosphaeraceae bacterium]|nr:hypothetical protein [Isosphaeraceae bacterium]
MKKLLLTGVAFTALVTGSAMAADQAAPAFRRPVLVEAPFSWSGFYIGIQGGAGWGATDLNQTSVAVSGLGFPTPATPVTNFESASYPLNGWHGGGTAGYNWEIGQLVLGVEGDISAANINGRGNCTS